MSIGSFPEECTMTERVAGVWARYGCLLLGPGPRHWTLLLDFRAGSPGAQYRIVGYKSGRFRLRKVREWH